jgi:exodeoxyribonuclease VII small subunit
VTPPDAATNAAEEIGFDELVTRLRDVVDRLEQGNLGLEESLKAYEEGVGLARRGHTLLDSAEKRVELLVRGAQGGDDPVTRLLDPETDVDGDAST